MAVRDTSIGDWSANAASNPPSDATYIGGDLAGQWRNMKSVARGESLDKEFERTGLVTAGATGGALSEISFFSDAGDQTAIFPEKRKVRLRPTDGSAAWVYSVVILASFSSTTSVVLVDVSGMVTTGESYFVDVGTERPGMSPVPLFTQSGTLTFANTTVAANATFTQVEPDEDYFAKLTVTATNSADIGSSVVREVVKSTTGLAVTINAQPGASSEVTFAYSIMREF